MNRPPDIIAISDCSRGDLDRWLTALEGLLALAAPERVMVMLRDRQLTARERMALGRRLRALTRRHRQLLSVNDRLDLAVLLDADALHLSESSVAASDARAFAGRSGRSFWISRAAHEPEEAAAVDADAILLAPIMAPRKGRAALGLAGIERARSARDRRPPALRRCAIFALGGVDGTNAASCVRSGADGIALIGALLDPGAPRVLLEAFDTRRSTSESATRSAANRS